MIISTGHPTLSTMKQRRNFGEGAMRMEIYTKRNIVDSTVLGVKDF